MSLVILIYALFSHMGFGIRVTDLFKKLGESHLYLFLKLCIRLRFFLEFKRNPSIK